LPEARDNQVKHFWRGMMRTALITPHTGGDTHRYEDTVLDMLDNNLNRLWRNETRLYNQII
jgi:D-2-hydroxyacid dehydrogenase (NADP+)